MTPQERTELLETIVAAMTATTGPVNDMIRSTMAATVDGLIDARRQMINAGWPEWMVMDAMEVLMGASRRAQAHRPGLMIGHEGGHDDGGT